MSGLWEQFSCDDEIDVLLQRRGIQSKKDEIVCPRIVCPRMEGKRFVEGLEGQVVDTLRIS